ncbi:MAG TPA: hypothetical protein VGH28_20405 [Polyangiaceae bacterium]|jgi:hypothetical protein
MRPFILAILSSALFACAAAAEQAPEPRAEPDPVIQPAETAAPVRAEPVAASPPPETQTAQTASFTVAHMSVDGVELSDIACTAEPGSFGLLGALALGAGFASRKTQLDACAATSTKTRVEWTTSDGKMSDVHAHGRTPAVSRCVEHALRGAVSTTPGSCAATLEHGKR